MEKLYFTQQQAKEIKYLLDLRLNTKDKKEFKRISSRLRNRGFFISEFGYKFSSLDFEKEVSKGNFVILEKNLVLNPADEKIKYSGQNNNSQQTTSENKRSNFVIIALIIFASLYILGTLIEDDNKEPQVIKKNYNSSYDQQVMDIKRDIKKCDDWVEGIVIYDDNCDTVAIINR